MKRNKKTGKIRSAILEWFGAASYDNVCDMVGLNYGTTEAGQRVNEKTVLSLSAAWACTRLISQAIATMPLHIYEKTADGRKVASNHRLSDILSRSPNANSTASTYWEASTASILLRGNSISEKQYVGSRFVGLKFLPECRLSKQKINGKTELLYRDNDGKQRIVKKENIFHVPGFSLDGEWGASVISMGASVFGSALAASTAANKTFEKGLSPTVALTIDRVLKKEQRTEFRESFAAISGAINAGETAVLEGGMGVETIGIKPSDAQLLESRSYSVEEVCRWFGVDPSMVGHGNKDSNWGTGLEQKMISFLTFTLGPWLKRIEQAINKNLLTPAEQGRYYAEFSVEGLLRSDSKSRAAFYSVMVNNGIYTRDEVRKLENMPLKGGNADVLTVQTAMAPLDTLGQPQDSERARAALKAWLDNEDSNGHQSAE